MCALARISIWNQTENITAIWWLYNSKQFPQYLLRSCEFIQVHFTVSTIHLVYIYIYIGTIIGIGLELVQTEWLLELRSHNNCESRSISIYYRKESLYVLICDWQFLFYLYFLAGMIEGICRHSTLWLHIYVKI